jgi:Holliday junction DNA helicase RuvA
MIAHLEGTIRHKSPDSIVLDVHGVGYCVHVPLSTYYELPPLGGTVGLHTHTHVREDALQLYGFRTMAEKEMFLFLVTINGVGPRLALNILSGISADDLRHVIYQEDRRRLQHIPGVGRKIAERIILELRDKLRIAKPEGLPFTVPVGGSAVLADAFSALMNLGYRPEEAERVLKRLGKEVEEEVPLGELLKKALSLLA